MRWALTALAISASSYGVVQAEEGMPERIRHHCAAIDEGQKLAKWKRAVKEDDELASTLRSIEESQAFIAKWAPVLTEHEKQAAYAARQLKKQRGKNGRDKWQAEFDRENGSAFKVQKAILEAKQRLKNDQERVEKLKQTAADGAKEGKQNETSPPYRSEPFRKLREDGSFRQGDDYLRIGEVFFFEETVTKDKAAEMRDARKRGGTADWDNLAILQVLDKESVLTSFRYGLSKFPRVDSTVFLMRGIDTSEIRERNLSTWFQTGTFIVSGTHRYETTTGRLNTVFVLEPFDAAEIKKWWPVYQAEKQRK